MSQKYHFVKKNTLFRHAEPACRSDRFSICIFYFM